MFENRNLVGRMVVPDLLAACGANPPPEAEVRDGCVALRGWDLRNNLKSRGVHLFREFWRQARNVRNLWRVGFDPAQSAATPHGLKMHDAAVAAGVRKALAGAVKTVRAAGFALDTPLAEVLRAVNTDPPIGLHGGDESVGVLDNIGQVTDQPIGPRGLVVDYGTSHVQVVGVDERGPVVEALLTFGPSRHPSSPHATDQTRLFARKAWQRHPFRAEDVAARPWARRCGSCAPEGAAVARARAATISCTHAQTSS
jgi:acyl-homoserine-lactone acylase